MLWPREQKRGFLWLRGFLVGCIATAIGWMASQHSLEVDCHLFSAVNFPPKTDAQISLNGRAEWHRSILPKCHIRVRKETL